MNKAAARNSKPNGGGRPMLTGMIFGVLLGLIMSGVVAWYVLTKNPNSFVGESAHEKAKPSVEVKPAPTAKDKAAESVSVAPASGVAEVKPQFEFYKVLTDSKTEGGTALENSASAQSAKNVTAESKELNVLQAGAFQKQEDAEKLKAKLAMIGIEANIQSPNVPDKGLWYRVRLGPYSSAGEMNKALAMLKQNGMNATPIRPQ